MSIKVELIGQTLSFSASILAGIALAAGIYLTGKVIPLEKIEYSSNQLEVIGVRDEVIKAIREQELKKADAITVKLASMEEAIAKMASFTTKNNSAGYESFNLKLPVIENQVIELKKELMDLKEIITGDPNAALVIGALKKDIEILKESDIRIHQDLSNYAGIGMWMIGILITVSLALFGFSLATHLKKKT